MKLTLEQLTERDDRRRRWLETLSQWWLFYEWVDGLGWQECDVHAWRWARVCMKISLTLARCSGEPTPDRRIAYRRRRPLVAGIVFVGEVNAQDTAPPHSA